GAVGDGATDNTAGFQNAVSVASISGGAIYVPAGNPRYLLSGTLILANPVRVYGDAKYASILRYSGTGSFISCTGNSTVKIENLSVQLTGNNAVGIDLSQCLASTLESVRVAATSGTGQIGIQANITNTGWTSF